MAAFQKEISVVSRTQFEIIDITPEVKKAVAQSKISSGIAVIFSPHTTASIRINQEESLLKQDIMKLLYRLAPIDINYAHDFFEIRTNIKPGERSNGHAHVKALLLGSSEAVPIVSGNLVLGERQNIFFVEFDGGRKRKAIVEVLGE
ncbi:MAG: YjbQ family protein [Candidatus Doudnabacteria bacterium]|nr:YjbQ family protein [Candidatus Doudnabacteria bacterium]